MNRSLTSLKRTKTPVPLEVPRENELDDARKELATHKDFLVKLSSRLNGNNSNEVIADHVIQDLPTHLGKYKRLIKVALRISDKHDDIESVSKHLPSDPVKRRALISHIQKRTLEITNAAENIRSRLVVSEPTTIDLEKLNALSEAAANMHLTFTTANHFKR